MRLMGLDISTTTIGISIIEETLETDKFKLVFQHYFKPPEKDLPEFEYLQITKRYILKIVEEFKPDLVAIEDYSKFMKGKSSATTILKLATLNRMLGFAIFEAMGHEPFLLNVIKIRHNLKLGTQLPAKEEIPELVVHYLDLEGYPYYYEQDKKGNIKIKTESFDVADSMAVAICALRCYLAGEDLKQVAPEIKAKKKAKKRKKKKK